VSAESWLGDITLSDLQIRHFAVWRDERLPKVKPNTVMRELRILRILIDWARDERGAEIKGNPARHLRLTKLVFTTGFPRLCILVYSK